METLITIKIKRAIFNNMLIGWNVYFIVLFFVILYPLTNNNFLGSSSGLNNAISTMTI